jgi:hypothetical protein
VLLKPSHTQKYASGFRALPDLVLKPYGLVLLALRFTRIK